MSSGCARSLPFAACGLCGARGQTVESSIARVDLHAVRIDVIGIAADESRLCGQRKLHVAFGQGLFRFLAFADVDGHVDHAGDGTCRVKQGCGIGDDWDARTVLSLDDCLHPSHDPALLQCDLGRAVCLGHRCAVGMTKLRKVIPLVLSQDGRSSPQIDRALVAVEDVPRRIGHVDGGGQRPEQLTRHALALLQSVLDLFACGNIAADPQQSRRLPIGAPHDRAFHRNPTLVGTGGRRKPIFDLVVLARAPRSRIGVVEAGQVVWMYECPCLSRGPGRRPRYMPVNLAIPEIALEARVS